MNGSELVVEGLNGMERAAVLIAGMLFLSLLIERLLEIAKSYYDYLEAKHGWDEFWNLRFCPKTSMTTRCSGTRPGPIGKRCQTQGGKLSGRTRFATVSSEDPTNAH